MGLLFQTPFCTIFVLLSHSASKKEKEKKKQLSKDDAIWGFYIPLISSPQGHRFIFLVHYDSWL